jgi:hypothetical protein
MLEVDTCDNCGAKLEGQAHFAVGKTWCAACWSGQRPPVANPPTPAYQRQIELWCAPRTPTQAPKGKAPAVKQTHSHHELVTSGKVANGQA